MTGSLRLGLGSWVMLDYVQECGIGEAGVRI